MTYELVIRKKNSCRDLRSCLSLIGFWFHICSGVLSAARSSLDLLDGFRFVFQVQDMRLAEASCSCATKQER